MLVRYTLLACCISAHAALPAQERVYFQQQVDYDIDVALDPAVHTLSATGHLTYRNNSPEALDSIPVQLWANAYASTESAFAQQVRRHGSAKFHYAKDGERGGYRTIALSGPEVASTRTAHPELVYVYPVNPLRPGDTLRVDFDYVLRVPKTFSRMGRSGTNYQITQWYPKPALYDTEGWHPYPYLDNGEYFNDFGDYRVRVTVPANGIVGATGALVNPEGRAARQRRIAASTTSDTVRVDTLGYGAGTITYVFEAEGVTDFAWFADSKFRVGTAQTPLANRTLPSYAYYTKRQAHYWRAAAGLIGRAAAFADSLVGAYPHPQISAVFAELGVGGGMEYPMITVINPMPTLRDLDDVLAHEAFHNWFALHVASDERTHPWMDEGMTTWLEGRYMERYYGDEATDDILPKSFVGDSRYTDASLLHTVLAKAARNPPVDAHSDDVSPLGYSYVGYTQPGRLLKLAERNVGRARFDGMVRDYYAAWGGRHPGVDDLAAAIDWDAAGMDFEWAFLRGEGPDYAIRSAEYDDAGLLRLELENRSPATGPVLVETRTAGGEYVPAATLPGFTGAQTFQVSTAGTATAVAIDPAMRTSEVDRADNYRRVGGGRGRGLSVGFLPKAGDPTRRHVGLAPVVSFNEADKLLLGFGLHNYTADVGPLRYFLSPQIGTRGGDVTGFGRVAYSFYRRNAWWRELELSAAGRSYGYDFNDNYDVNPRFTRVTLAAELLLAADYGLRSEHRLGLRSDVVGQAFVRGINLERGEFALEDRRYVVTEAAYEFRHRDPITPWGTRLALEAGQDYGRLSAKLNYGFRYRSAPTYLRLRAFAGGFLFRDDPDFRAVLLPNGVTGFGREQNDYTFRENLVNRAEPSNQYFVRDGSLTLPFVLPQASSTTWLTSLSATVDAPVQPPAVTISAYGDLAIYPDERPGQSGVVAPATAGLRIGLPLNLGSVSFPLFNSGFVRESLAFTRVGATYRERIALRLDLSNLDLDEILRRLRG